MGKELVNRENMVLIFGIDSQKINIIKITEEIVRRLSVSEKLGLRYENWSCTTDVMFFEPTSSSLIYGVYLVLCASAKPNDGVTLKEAVKWVLSEAYPEEYATGKFMIRLLE